MLSHMKITSLFNHVLINVQTIKTKLTSFLNTQPQTEFQWYL